MKVSAQRNEESGHVEIGVEDGGHFVAFTTMPVTQFDTTIANLEQAKADEQTPSK